MAVNKKRIMFIVFIFALVVFGIVKIIDYTRNRTLEVSNIEVTTEKIATYLLFPNLNQADQKTLGFTQIPDIGNALVDFNIKESKNNSIIMQGFPLPKNVFWSDNQKYALAVIEYDPYIFGKQDNPDYYLEEITNISDTIWLFNIEQKKLTFLQIGDITAGMWNSDSSTFYYGWNDDSLKAIVTKLPTNDLQKKDLISFDSSKIIGLTGNKDSLSVNYYENYFENYEQNAKQFTKYYNPDTGQEITNTTVNAGIPNSDQRYLASLANYNINKKSNFSVYNQKTKKKLIFPIFTDINQYFWIDNSTLVVMGKTSNNFFILDLDKKNYTQYIVKNITTIDQVYFWDKTIYIQSNNNIYQIKE